MNCCYTPPEGDGLNIYDEKASILYKGNSIELHYMDEPPHGDFLYSVRLPDLDLSLPFWIYGRNLICLGPHYMLVEAVPPRTWSPISSTLLNLCNGQWARLGGWYDQIDVEDGTVRLYNQFSNESNTLHDFSMLSWNPVPQRDSTDY